MQLELPLSVICINLIPYNRHEADLNCVTVPLNKHRKSICNFVRSELFLINGHEADLNSVTSPQRIKDSDKYRVEGAKPTLITKGFCRSFI